MGGKVAIHEPNFVLLQHPEALKFFIRVGWPSYFKKLQGFNELVALEFPQGLVEQHFVIRGFRIVVIEEVIAKETGLPRIGEWWLSRKVTNIEAMAIFL